MHRLGNFAHLPSALHHSCPLLRLLHPWPCPHQVLCPNHHIIQAIIRLWQRCVIYIKTELICDKLQVNNHKHYFHCKREDSSLPCLQRPLTQVAMKYPRHPYEIAMKYPRHPYEIAMKYSRHKNEISNESTRHQHEIAMKYPKHPYEFAMKYSRHENEISNESAMKYHNTILMRTPRQFNEKSQ